MLPDERASPANSTTAQAIVTIVASASASAVAVAAGFVLAYSSVGSVMFLL